MKEFSKFAILLIFISITTSAASPVISTEVRDKKYDDKQI